MPRDDAHLLDIPKAARRAIEFKGPAEKAEFFEEAKTQSAFLHQLLIIGEAVKRMSPEFRAAHPEVPWMLIAGTRDKLIPQLKQSGELGRCCRTSPYLNNIIEQDHRFIKKRITASLGFRSAEWAWRTIGVTRRCMKSAKARSAGSQRATL